MNNLSEKVKVIQTKIISLLNKKEELEKNDIMYANFLEETKEKNKDLKELEGFMFHDKININVSIFFFGIGKLLVYLFFVLESVLILVRFDMLFSMTIIEIVFYNVLCISLFNVFNKALKDSKRARKINFNYFGDRIYDSKRIQERREFFKIEKQRLLRKRFEIEKESLENDIEIEDLNKLLRDVVSNYNNGLEDNSFFKTVYEQDNFMQQFMFGKRR